MGVRQVVCGTALADSARDRGASRAARVDFVHAVAVPGVSGVEGVLLQCSTLPQISQKSILTYLR